MIKNSLKKKTNKKGFTLVELVMVVALIAILAAIAVPTVTNVISTANTNVDASNAKTIELAIKTADAELQAGTWSLTRSGTVVTHSTLLVSEALTHEGITQLPTAKVTGALWRYDSDKSGNIHLDQTSTGRSDLVFATTKVSDIIP
jgi:type IV pilus assembly protein PilA